MYNQPCLDNKNNHIKNDNGLYKYYEQYSPGEHVDDIAAIDIKPGDDVDGIGFITEVVIDKSVVIFNNSIKRVSSARFRCALGDNHYYSRSVYKKGLNY